MPKLSWKPSEGIEWEPLSAEPVPPSDASKFALMIQCRSAEERDQISAELTKHGIKCTVA